MVKTEENKANNREQYVLLDYHSAMGKLCDWARMHCDPKCLRK